MKRLTILILVLLAISTVVFTNNDRVLNAYASSNLTAEIAIEKSTKRVLYGSNIHAKKYVPQAMPTLTSTTEMAAKENVTHLITEKSHAEQIKHAPAETLQMALYPVC